MHELRIGDISRLTGRTTEHIRRCERAGIIPEAKRIHGVHRYWDEGDIPAICKGLGVALPPTLEDRLMRDLSEVLGSDQSSNPLDDLLAIFRKLAPVIAEEVERVTSGQDIGKELTRS